MICIAKPVEGESKGIEAGVAGQDLQGLHRTESVMGQIERMEEQHVSDALARINQVVAEIHNAQVHIRAQALQLG